MPEPYILMLDEVDSTNTYARNHFDELPDGAIVAARSQTAGAAAGGGAGTLRPEAAFCARW